jgi:hypothetical protein
MGGQLIICTIVAKNVASKSIKGWVIIGRNSLPLNNSVTVFHFAINFYNKKGE